MPTYTFRVPTAKQRKWQRYNARRQHRRYARLSLKGARKRAGTHFRAFSKRHRERTRMPHKELKIFLLKVANHFVESK